MKLEENDIKLYLGSAETKVYLGTTQVYPSEEPTPVPYSGQYLTFEAISAGTFTLTIGSAVTTGDVVSVSYSLDNGNTWTTTNNVQGQQVVITTPTVNAGDKVLWKGSASRMGNSTSALRASRFSSTNTFNAEGNVMSLLYGDNFVNQTILQSTNTFNWLFNGCTSIISTENLILPATTLRNGCYNQMFKGCTNLTTAPVLPATTLDTGCYYSMFSGCTSLTTAPELPATTLTGNCYRDMFNGCSSLNYIKCLATDISARNCISNWVDGVAATGTFVKAASMSDWTTGSDGIPDGWTIQNDGGIQGGGGTDPDFGGGPDDGGAE